MSVQVQVVPDSWDFFHALEGVYGSDVWPCGWPSAHFESRTRGVFLKTVDVNIMPC